MESFWKSESIPRQKDGKQDYSKLLKSFKFRNNGLDWRNRRINGSDNAQFLLEDEDVGRNAKKIAGVYPQHKWRKIKSEQNLVFCSVNTPSSVEMASLPSDSTPPSVAQVQVAVSQVGNVSCRQEPRVEPDTPLQAVEPSGRLTTPNINSPVKKSNFFLFLTLGFYRTLGTQ